MGLRDVKDEVEDQQGDDEEHRQQPDEGGYGRHDSAPALVVYAGVNLSCPGSPSSCEEATRCGSVATMATELMPAAFFGHGNPMNALEVNRYTSAWRAFGAAVPNRARFWW